MEKINEILSKILTNQNSNWANDNIGLTYHSLSKMTIRQLKKHDYYKISKDIVSVLEGCEKKNSIKYVKLSSTIRKNEFIKSYKNIDLLDSTQVETLKSTIKATYKNELNSSALLDVIVRLNNRDSIRWWLNLLIGVIGLVLTATNIYIATKFKYIETLIKLMEQ